MGRDTRDPYRDRRDDGYPDDRGDSRRERPSRNQGSGYGGSGRLGDGSPTRQPYSAGDPEEGRSGRLSRGGGASPDDRRYLTPERVDRRYGSDPRGRPSDPRGRSDPRLRRSDSPPPSPAYDEAATRSRDNTGERGSGRGDGRPDGYDTPGRSRNGRRGVRDLARDVSRQLSSVMSRVGRAVEGTPPRGISRSGVPAVPGGGDGYASVPARAFSEQQTVDLRAQAYRRSRNRMVARKWRLGRVRPNPLGYLLVIMTVVVLLGVVTAGGTAGGIYAVSYYQRHIPDIQQIAGLRDKQNSIIYDRNGKQIYQANSNGQYQTYEPLSEISEYVQAATIDTEDHSFYSNSGIDLYGTLRAALADVQAGGAAQGGSTITQQLVKNIVLDDTSQNIQRKLNEAILAYGVTQQYTKAFILEMYLNTIPYSGLYTGIEAAAENFFNLKPNGQQTANQQLDWAQAAILAGLPNAPGEYDPTIFSCSKAPCPTTQWSNPFEGRPEDCGNHIPTFDENWWGNPANGHEWLVFCRAELVLYNVYQYGVPGDAALDLSWSGYQNAVNEVLNILINQQVYPFQATTANSSETAKDLAPHFVQYIADQMSQFGITNLATAGLNIYTTLDLPLQEYAQATVQKYVDHPYCETYYGPTPGSENCFPALSNPANANAHNGALVAIDQRNGDILAMVGSVDYNNTDPRVAGSVNITTSPYRSMGSATKPLMYSTAFEMGWTPGTMLQDIPVCFPVPETDPTTNKPIVSPVAPACKGWYVPQDYEATNFSGTFPLRRQFDGSLNIPATEGMEFVGATPATSTNFIDMAERLGVTTIAKDQMGPTTALGTQSISLLQLTSAYGTFANLGARAPARGILRITRADGTALWSAPAMPQTQQAISPQAAFMITSVLSDNRARYPFFKVHNPLVLDSWDPGPANQPNYWNNFPIAAKTGTSSGQNGPADIVTAGYSPYMTLGVWVGNDNNDDLTPGVIGVTGAGYIFHDVMLWAANNFGWNPNVSFPIPPQMARGTFNCNTGLAPYQNSTQADLYCAWNEVPKSALPASLFAPGTGNTYGSYNPYDPDGDFKPVTSQSRTHMYDTDWYILGDQPITS